MKFIYLLFIICCLGLPSHAAPVSSNDLVEDALHYDGARIEYIGEVVGDLMVRGEHVWLNVNDGNRAIGVWAKKSLVKNIKHTGGYRYLGDKIKVVGIFNRACPEHGGDLDIHAQKLSVIQEGHKIEHPINPSKGILAVIFFIAVLALIFYPILLKPRP